MIRHLLIGAAMAATAGYAQSQVATAFDLTPKLALIESIQRQENAKPPLDLPYIAVTLGNGQHVSLDGPCVGYAGSKVIRLAEAGIPARSVIVQTEPDRHGVRALHMVVEIDGNLRGKPVEMVLDSRPEFPSWTTKAQLIRQGYTWDYGAAPVEALLTDPSKTSPAVAQAPAQPINRGN